MRERIESVAARYAGRIAIWDVINENYKNDSITNLLGDDVVVDWFRWAKQASGGARLYWNEIHVLPDTERGAAARKHTYERVRNLIDKGAPIDGIGIQGHLGVGPASPHPEMVLQRLDAFAELGLEIQITEFDVNINDRSDPDQVAFQADYLRDFMIAVFSHPSVAGVIHWTTFPHKWLPNTALVEKDGTLRPHGRVWKELVTETWWTDEAGTTDAQGSFTARAFLGQHQITVTHAGQTTTANVTLNAEGDTVYITLP